MITSHNLVKWVLADALVLIRELQPIIFKWHYHVTLGGGVLNRGQSEKDLDLFFYPLNGYDSQPYHIVKTLDEALGCHGVAMRDGPDYHVGAMWHYPEMRVYMYQGKRIDVFIQ